MTRNYYKTNAVSLNEIREDQIPNFYDKGYVLTRLSVMQQTRSLRVVIDKFEPSSENRRVIAKAFGLRLQVREIPLLEEKDNWKILKMGKDFYANKFDDVTFSSNKIRELIYKQNNSKFNRLLVYASAESDEAIGYCIGYQEADIFHYCYPFYDLSIETNNLGMGMMLQALAWAKESNLKYFYIGSATRPSDKYKLQFNSLEWFDGQSWSQDIEKLKSLLNDIPSVG